MNYTVRTIDEIFTELLLEKQNLSSLNGLIDGGISDENSLITSLSNSKVAEWIKWLYNMAVQIHLTELRTLSVYTDVNDLFDNQIVSTEKWYIQKAKEFQYGDSVVIDPITYQAIYEVIDETKQIIESATVKTFSNKLILKVRRKDTDILSNPELIAFESYLSDIKTAGTQIRVDNFDGDELTLNMTIIYKGSYTLSIVQTAVETAINEYLNNLEFDSKFQTSSLIDILQVIDGVIDPRFDSGSTLDSLGNTVTFVHEYETNAGWAQINSLTPLSSTITYIAK